MENYLNNLFDDISDDFPELVEDEKSVLDAIRNFKDRKPLDTDVLDYWYRKRFSHPSLYKLACVVLAVPATQVSVECCFSVLKFIFSDHRSRLGAETLENIMLIHLNDFTAVSK